MTAIGSTATLLLTGAWLAASLSAATGAEVQNYEVNKGFEGTHSTDLSGIACVPLNHGEYRCLAIDDERKFAQLAKFENGAIEAKAKIRLIKKEDDPEPLGEKPSVACPNGPGDFGEFDGEGVAYAPPYFYVVGSHGCSRRGGKFRLSSFILARIRVDDSGRPVDALGNVVDEDDMEKVVSSGHKPLPPAPIPVPIPVPLGDKVGIRDLALLPDDKLLILAGAAYQPDIPYSIVLLDLKEKAPKELVARRQDQPARAEGMAVLSATPQEIRVLLLFDGALDGTPQELRIPLSQ